MNCVSCDIYMRVPPLVCLCLFPGVFLSSRVTGVYPVTTDLIMRVNVRTTTTFCALKNMRNLMTPLNDEKITTHTCHMMSYENAIAKCF